jgi:hypothetical protein
MLRHQQPGDAFLLSRLLLRCHGFPPYAPLQYPLSVTPKTASCYRASPFNMCVVVATPNLDTVSQRNCRQEPDTRMTVMCRRFSCSSSNIDVERAAPSPLWGVTPPRVVYPRPRPALPGPRRYSGLMRQTSTLSRPTHDGLVRESLQVAACPLLGRGPSRCYLLNLCGGAWTRTPSRFCGALTRFFPQNLGLTLRARGSAR